MRVVVIGGSGLIGRALIRDLLHHHHEVILVTRSPQRTSSLGLPGVEIVGWKEDGQQSWLSALERSQAVVNLAGESIGEGRWTKRRKESIRSSRVKTTRLVSETIAASAGNVRILLNASAVGYYGNVPNGDVTETYPAGRDFLANVCAEWEESLKWRGLSPLSPLAGSAQKKQDLPRICILRTGLVLSPQGGALAKLLLPFKLGVGGQLGSGQQWLPWIHIHDEIRAIRFLLEHPDASGPFNLAAPNPVTMSEFARTLGRVLRRPSFMRVPAFALKMILGEMAEPLLLEGQRAIPKRLMELGFTFEFGELETALKDLLTER